MSKSMRVSGAARLECTSWRECNFYIDYLVNVCEQRYEFDDIYEYRSIDSCSRDIMREIEHGGCSDVEKLIKGINKQYQASQLTSSDFSLLNKNTKRACNWAWLFLHKQTIAYDNDRYNNSPFEDGVKRVSPRRYRSHSPRLRLDAKSLEAHPNNINERISAIKDAFLFSEVDKEGQIQIIELMKHIWLEIFQHNHLGDWLKQKDTEQCDWAWNYIKNSEHSRYFTTWPPINHDEKYFAIQAVFDHGSWENPDKVNLLLNSMKKAWSQKKFRDKSEGKKPYSVTMTTKTKDRLDELVLHHELKITDIIERLIKEEYEKVYG